MHHLHYSRFLLAATGALALAACSTDRAIPTAPQTASRSLQSAGATIGDDRFIVLANGGGFAKNFADRVAAMGGTVEFIHQGAGLAVVSGLDSASAAGLKAVGASDVQPDVTISLDQTLGTAEADASAVGDPIVASQADPTLASRYSWQWNMTSIGAEKAWAAGKLGDPGVTVAILDTGIDYDAPDLAGLVDLSRSISFIPGDDAITGRYFPSRNKITDYHGHGTNVATQVSSKARALAGVTSKTTLIGVKVLSGAGSGPLNAILAGVLWAADHGADVANMSLGGGFTKAGNGRYVGLINRVFNYAKSKGMLIVVAAGNDEMDLDHNGNFNADYCDAPQVMCVAATGPTTWGGDPTASSFFTNFGRSAIDVAAPGGNAQIVNGEIVASTWPWGADIASWVWSYCSKTQLVFDKAGNILGQTGCYTGNRITGYIGTSQATPHVAGLAALLVAERGHGQPALIKNLIEKSADDLGQPGTDPFYGKGRINVAKALGL